MLPERRVKSAEERARRAAEAAKAAAEGPGGAGSAGRAAGADEDGEDRGDGRTEEDRTPGGDRGGGRAEETTRAPGGDRRRTREGAAHAGGTREEGGSRADRGKSAVVSRSFGGRGGGGEEAPEDRPDADVSPRAAADDVDDERVLSSFFGIEKGDLGSRHQRDTQGWRRRHKNHATNLYLVCRLLYLSATDDTLADDPLISNKTTNANTLT